MYVCIKIIYLLWVVYLNSVENVITLGKLIGLLFLFCLPLLSILFLKTKRNDLARPVMGTIFLVYVVQHHYMYTSTKYVTWHAKRGLSHEISKKCFFGIN